MALESRDRWVRAAEGWEARANPFGRDTMPVSTALVEGIDPQPGQTVLDLAAGLGDTGYLAYELIQPGGTLITSDFVPEMLSAAQRRAPQGAKNIRFRQMDMTVPLDQPAATIDGIVCRWGFMLLPDPEFALKEARRVLKQDGHLALAAWTGPDENLWSAAPVRILERRGILEPSDPSAPGQFTWANPDDIVETLEAAGFIDPEVDALDFTMRYADLDDWWLHVTNTSTRIGDADKTMDFATRSDVLAELEEQGKPFEQPDDRLEIPARTWIATATA